MSAEPGPIFTFCIGCGVQVGEPSDVLALAFHALTGRWPEPDEHANGMCEACFADWLAKIETQGAI